MKTIDDLDVAGKTVLLRADFNVPLAKDGSGTITDDGRIVAALPTINALREKGAKIIVVAHLGRPAGTGFEEAYSLDPVAKRMGELLGTEVKLACDVTGESAKELAANLAEGDVMLLENVRFDKREASKVDEDRQALAQELVGLGAEAYVSDGFGVVHRKQASVTDVAALLPNAAGSLVAKEVHAFDKVLNDPERPYVVVLGGAKVSDKLGVINNLLSKVDRLVIGGGMCFTFLKAKGYNIGKSLLEEEQVEQCREYIERAERDGVELILPVDIVCAPEFSADAPTTVVAADAIPDDQMGLDIGPESITLFRSKLEDAKSVVWNGPMGVFELAPFATGTLEVAKAIGGIDGTSVVGGGDSAAAVRKLGLEDVFTHISTGGGASLELLEGKVLPGLAALEG